MCLTTNLLANTRMTYFRNFLAIGLLMLAYQSQAQTTAPFTFPSGYLYKIEPGIPDHIVYVCVQRPFNTSGFLVGAGDLAAQTRQVFENVKTSLASVNMTLKDITQITYMIKEAVGITSVTATKAQVLTAVADAYLPQVPKIVTTKGIAQTLRDDVLIEVEVITVK